MTVELHDEAKSRIQEIISECLSRVMIENNFSPNYQTLYEIRRADAVLPSNGRMRDQLEKYFDEYPIYEFVNGELRHELFARRYEEDSKSIPLVDIPEFSDPQLYARHLIGKFSSLPWNYVFTVKLPSWLDGAFEEDEVVEISDDAQVVRFGPKMGAEFPFHPAYSTARIGSQYVNYSEFADGTYFRFFISGYVPHHYGGGTVTAAHAGMKSFLGMSVAERLADISRSYRVEPAEVVAVVHVAKPEGWVHQGHHELPMRLGRAFTEMSLVEFPASIDLRDFVQRQLADIRPAFMAGPTSDRIRLAAEWLFDSVTSESDLLAFVQAMVVLEIVLGDKAESDKLGLGELLKNRCAYLIGEDQDQREGILREFPEIYRVRSNIVHSGKSRISPRERSMLFRLRSIAVRVIQKEGELIRRSKR